MADEQHQELREVLRPAWENRKTIAMVALIVTVVVFAINFLFPSYYRAQASLLPETERSPSSITQFADLAQLAGLQGGGEIARLYPAILESETILRPVISRLYDSELLDKQVTLIDYFRIEEDTPEESMSGALESLRNLLSVSLDSRTTIVTLALEMREPQVAAVVLNAMIEELDLFMRVKRKTSASEQLTWITTRLEEVGEELRAAEDSREMFRDRNRRISDSPGLLLVQERLLRAVHLSSATFVELTKQYELSKIDVIKNTTVVNVLDPARAPTIRSRPRRVLNTGLSVLAVVVVLSIYYSGTGRRRA